MIPRSAQLATEVTKAGETFIAALGAALMVAKASTTPEEVEQFKRAVGQVIGTVEVDLLWPLYKQFPELEPPALRGDKNDG